MDRDAALEELRGLADVAAGSADGQVGDPIDCHDILRIAELVEALDGWLAGAGGGVLPRRW